MNYQLYDWACFRYDLWNLDGVGFLRGPDPRPIQPARYVTVLGAASAFGRHAEEPFAHTLRKTLGIPVLNLSASAAGPSYFLNNERILELVNGSAACIVQATAARSCGNSEYNNEHSGKGVVKRTADGPDAEAVNIRKIYQKLWDEGRVDEALRLIAESKATWVDENIALLNAIRVPKIFLWLSSREPDYEPDMKSYQTYTGAFPQLVDGPMVEAVRPHADAYVKVATRAGLPIPFYNRFTGGQGECFFGSSYRKQHDYYASPEMHAEASRLLHSALERLLRDTPLAGAPAAPPSPHEQMLASAEEAGSGGDGVTEPFPLVAALNAVNGFHLDHTIEGGVVQSGEIDAHFARCLHAIGGARYTRTDGGQVAGGQQRFVVYGGGIDGRAAAVPAMAAGGAVWVCGAEGRGELVQRLVDAGLEPVSLLDTALLMGAPTESADLGRWLRKALNDAVDPAWTQERASLLEWKKLTYHRSRASAEFAIDHAGVKHRQRERSRQSRKAKAKRRDAEV